MNARLDTLIEEYGLQGQRDRLLATVRPAILMRLGEPGAGPVGVSRIGGVPDLPPSLDWPRTDGSSRQYFGFVLQINLADVPEISDSPLPREGMLYLFEGDDQDPKQILLYRGGETLQPTPAPSDTTCAVDYLDDLVPHRLTFDVIADIPRWASSDFEELAETISAVTDDPETENLLDDLGRDLSNGSVGKLLGHVAGIGHDPREDAFVVREVDPAALYDYERRATLDLSRARRWHNLLQVDSARAVGLMFGDAGYLNVLIHEDDLARQDVGRVYVNLESS